MNHVKQHEKKKERRTWAANAYQEGEHVGFCKQFCEWGFEQGDQKSQQNELELVLELDGDFFGKKMECVGAGISGGGPPGGHQGPTRQGARPGGVGVPSTLVAWCLPLLQ